MKRLAMILTAVLALATARAQTPAASERTPAQYRDKNRVLLVFAPTAQDAACLEQTRLWKNEKAEFENRQLAILPVLADSSELVTQLPVLADSPGKPDPAAAAALAKKYNVDARTFAVVLIGKDGHDAFRASRPVKPETLYGVIDAMPMRRTEVRRAQASASPTPLPTPRKPDLNHDE